MRAGRDDDLQRALQCNRGFSLLLRSKPYKFGLLAAGCCMLCDMIIGELSAADKLRGKCVCKSWLWALEMMLVERESSGRASDFICQDAGKGHELTSRRRVPWRHNILVPEFPCSSSSLQTCLEVAGPHLQTTTSIVLGLIH